MSLYTTYGVQSSVPAKTVVAVITPQVEATTNYDISFINNELLLLGDGSQLSNTGWARTDLVEIINNTIIINNFGLISSILYYSSNDFTSYISFEHFTSNTNSISIPNNATHFAFRSVQVQNSQYNDFISFSQFQTVIVSYNTSPPTTTNFSFSHLQNIDWLNFNSDYNSTSEIDISNISEFSVSNEWSYLYIYTDPNSRVEYCNINTTNSSCFFTRIDNNNIPTDGHTTLVVISLQGSRTWATQSFSYSQFQNLTVSYDTPVTTSTTVTFFDEYPNGTQIGDVVNVTGPAIINPPATYKIRQLVFEE